MDAAHRDCKTGRDIGRGLSIPLQVGKGCEFVDRRHFVSMHILDKRCLTSCIVIIFCHDARNRVVGCNPVVLCKQLQSVKPPAACEYLEFAFAVRAHQQ